jgi:hypothetical protein
MPTTIRPLPDLPAALVVCRFCDRGDALVLVNLAVPDSRLLALAQVLCTPEEREALAEYLTD